MWGLEVGRRRWDSWWDGGLGIEPDEWQVVGLGVGVASMRVDSCGRERGVCGGIRRCSLGRVGGMGGCELYLAMAQSQVWGYGVTDHTRENKLFDCCYEDWIDIVVGVVMCHLKKEKGLESNKRLFLAFASFHGLSLSIRWMSKLHFLYATITEEVNVKQPPGFEDPAHPNKVYRVVKALYGLHQAPRAWYERLSTFLLKHGYRRGAIDKTLFIKKDRRDIMLVQVYVDDIIFGSTKSSMVKDFEDLMQKEFKMSSMGELTFFLGLQVKQSNDGIFLSQDKYVKDILNKFDFRTIKPASTPIEAHKSLGKDEEGENVDVHLYRSMIGCLMYLTASRPDIMFAVCLCARFQVTPKVSHLHAVKRIFRLTPLQKAEYVALQVAVLQVLWMQNQLLDYGFNFMHTEIHIDNESTICIVKNPVFHSKTKHIQIRHHFIRDCYGAKAH
ncbi:putative ribonuclease H-like domain-containing protein [Tanacetum coccineum]|uniref:Ribonuclease H-like domain-containing protein n=1 Tax=Tanacetum coccineum TaxID=301880 RepID=A0ABQ5CMA5_9ASTR